MAKLNAEMKRFCAELVSNGGNKAAAYRVAYKSKADSTQCSAHAIRLLKKPEILAEITALQTLRKQIDDAATSAPRSPAALEAAKGTAVAGMQTLTPAQVAVARLMGQMDKEVAEVYYTKAWVLAQYNAIRKRAMDAGEYSAAKGAVDSIAKVQSILVDRAELLVRLGDLPDDELERRKEEVRRRLAEEATILTARPVRELPPPAGTDAA